MAHVLPCTFLEGLSLDELYALMTEMGPSAERDRILDHAITHPRCSQCAMRIVEAIKIGVTIDGETAASLRDSARRTLQGGE